MCFKTSLFARLRKDGTDFGDAFEKATPCSVSSLGKGTSPTAFHCAGRVHPLLQPSSAPPPAQLQALSPAPAEGSLRKSLRCIGERHRLRASACLWAEDFQPLPATGAAKPLRRDGRAVAIVAGLLYFGTQTPRTIQGPTGPRAAGVGKTAIRSMRDLGLLLGHTFRREHLQQNSFFSGL